MDSPSDRLRATFELFDVGLRLKRQNLKRRHPEASEVDVENLLANWLRERPGKRFGDGVGRPRRRSL